MAEVENYKPTVSQRPGVEWEGDDAEVTSPVYDAPVPNQEQILTDSGYDPEIWELADAPKISTWDAQFDGQIVRMWSYKFQPRRKVFLNDEDLRDIRNRVRKHKSIQLKEVDGNLAMVVCLADWQIGKADGYGLEGTIKKIKHDIAAITKRIKELRKIGRKIDTLIVVGMGDMVESCDGQYSTQIFRTEANRKEQILIIVDLLVEAMMAWAKLFPRIVISAVPGNHGENRKDFKMFTTKGDNDDLLVFELLRRVLDINPEVYGHVEWVIPEEDIFSIIKTHGRTLAFSHGHISGGGGEPQTKIKKWWYDHSFGKSPLAEADILTTAHYHHFSVVEYDNDRIHIQCPTVDGGCYSEDTEVLTKDGWKLHQNMTLDDEVAVFDPDSQVLDWMNPTKIHEFDYSGIMHNWTGRYMDLLVTPNHRMVMKNNQRWSGKSSDPQSWNFTYSEDVDSDVWNRIPVSAEWVDYEDDLKEIKLHSDYTIKDIDSFLYLIGMYISEGNLTNGHVVISQNAGPIAEKIRTSLDSLGVDYKVYSSTAKSGKEHLRFFIGVKDNPYLCAWLAGNCFIYSKFKEIPELPLSIRQKNILLGALMDGDGDEYGRYHTTSRHLADQFQRLAIQCGLQTMITKVTREDPWSDKYIVYTNSRREFAIRKNRHLSEVEYDGKVYCLTVPTGAYVTRRNGKMAICGNSEWFEDLKGLNSRTGTLTYLVGGEKPYQDLEIM